MQTNPTYPSQAGVDPEELDRRIADMYRDVANELAEDLHFPTGRPLAEALRYPADLLALLPAEAVNSFAGLGYHLGLARLLPGERVLDLGSGSGMDVSRRRDAGRTHRFGHRRRHHARAARQIRAPTPR